MGGQHLRQQTHKSRLILIPHTDTHVLHGYWDSVTLEEELLQNL